MRLCPRCNHFHHGQDSLICNVCWVELGQMALWDDSDNDEFQPPIDTVFDREEEARGYQ